MSHVGSQGRPTSAGRIVVLNGVPRSGKSSIVTALDGFVNFGVDSSMASTPEELLPGIGLRPGGERPDLEPHVVRLYDELWTTVASHASAGMNVAVDVGLHDCFSRPLGIFERFRRRLSGFEVLFVGVRCQMEEIVRRRQATWAQRATKDLTVVVEQWERCVHGDKVYDLEVDTSVLPAEACADLIRAQAGVERARRPLASSD